MSVKTEKKKYKLNCDCDRWEPFNLIWLNKRGGFDSYTFRLKSTQTLENTKSNWNRYLSSLKGNSWTYNIGDRGISSYYSDTIQKAQVLSTWMTEEEYNWVLELSQSNEVYLVKDGNLIPVALQNNTKEIRDKKGTGNRLLSHTMEFTYSYKIITQRG